MPAKTPDTTCKKTISHREGMEQYVQHLEAAHDAISDIEECLKSNVLHNRPLIQAIPMAVRRAYVLQLMIQIFTLTIDQLLDHITEESSHG